jgi:hypothetical protein
VLRPGFNNYGCRLFAVVRNAQRELRLRSFAIVIALLLTLTSCVPHYHPAGCEKVTDIATGREEALEREARESLKIGTKKDAVIRFFESQEIPVRFDRNEAIGEIHIHGGCAPKGCGTDDLLLGLRVHVDAAGTVLSEPVVVSMFTDCL